MNISAPFIKRPIGTSLLAAALLMAGALAFNFLPVAPLPQVEFPVISGRSRTAGRESGDHGFGGCHAAGAPVRPHRRHQPDDLDQPAGVDQHHSAVRSESQYRCRGARCAGRHQCRAQPAARQPAGQSDLPESESGGRAHHDSGAHFRHHHACRRCTTPPIRSCRRSWRRSKESARCSWAAAPSRRCAPK